MSMHCRANENAHVKWAFSIEWHSLGDSNPCYRRERDRIVCQCVFLITSES